MATETDRTWMALALALAEKGRGTVSPNPLVGAVVVRHGVIVGRGWHERAGDYHAEVRALRKAGLDARCADLYVTLEPCSHYGRTPPCTDVVIAAGVRRVIAAVEDPNPLVCGEGCRKLKAAGIEVEIGVLAAEARRQNEAFVTWIRERRPFVTLKFAATLDGRVADAAGSSRWITGPEARRRVHRMRAWSDAVMVGIGTVLADDPSLTVRDVPGRDPRRVIVDAGLRTPPDAKAAGPGCIVATIEGADDRASARLADRGVEILRCPGEDGRVSLPDLLRELGARKITSVLCEGGPTLAAALLREGLADKAAVFVAPAWLGGGRPAVEGIGVAGIADILRLRVVTIEDAGGDALITGYIPRGTAESGEPDPAAGD